jgi:outer membrane protein TolC
MRHRHFHRVLLGTVLAAAATLRAEPWTLDRAVATALERSPDARVARARLDGARALVDQTDAAWRPQVGLSGRYTATNSAMPAFGAILNQRAFDFGLDFNRPGTVDNLNTTGTVAYNLYSGGRTATRTAARAGSEAAALDLRAAHAQLAAAVVRSALRLRQAREADAATAAAVAALEAAVAAGQARHAAGQLLKADLLSLEVRLAEARETRSSARHAAALAARTFLFVLGLDPADPASVVLADSDPALARLTLPDTTAPSARPELLALGARLRAAEAQVDAARGTRRPAVNAFASYQFDHGWSTARHGDGWLAGVSVDVQVFDGGSAAAKVRAASAEVAVLREQLRHATLALGLEVESARLAHADAAERLAVSARAVAQAEESAHLSRARFAREALLAADLLGAESRLLEARLRRADALSAERLAVVDLRRALGLDPLPAP